MLCYIYAKVQIFGVSSAIFLWKTDNITLESLVSNEMKRVNTNLSLRTFATRKWAMLLILGFFKVKLQMILQCSLIFWGLLIVPYVNALLWDGLRVFSSKADS